MSTLPVVAVHEPDLQPQAWHRFDAFDPPRTVQGLRLGHYSSGATERSSRFS